MCTTANNEALDADLRQHNIPPDRELDNLIERLYEGTRSGPLVIDFLILTTSFPQARKWSNPTSSQRRRQILLTSNPPRSQQGLPPYNRRSDCSTKLSRSDQYNENRQEPVPIGQSPQPCRHSHRQLLGFGRDETYVGDTGGVTEMACADL